jgi:hypothetical protein
MKAKDIDFFEKVKGQIGQFHKEVSILSKSKSDNPINKFKLKFINEKLSEANTILTGEFKPLKDFTTFDEDSLPSNSDVAMILSQYLDCLEAWRCAHIQEDEDYEAWFWRVEGGQEIKTEPPSRFRKA